ncbi:hypothetical protein RI543_004526 [Arxiozyma heterogenica]|uniref:Transcription activator GCR1-like domain-containing protein n=1 Tax=Arxiozyma heterogenica TaxID=278026 RepID=A0AAN7WLR8_9SACH|nr:hypothetical protein RI543_004526 [Kazachstania heterogenica]
MSTTNIKHNQDSLKMATVDHFHNNIHSIPDSSVPVPYDYHTHNHHQNSYGDNYLLFNPDDNDSLLGQERLSALGKRLMHYETMFHNLNNKMDQSFKKYDTIIQSQQKQIIELSSTLSILLNDQIKGAGPLKEKLSSTSTTGISSQIAYLDNTPQYHHHNHHNNPQQYQQTEVSSMINNTHILFNAHSTEDLLQEILSNETSSISTPITVTGTNPIGAQIDFQSQNVPIDMNASFAKEAYDPLNGSIEKYPNTASHSKDLPKPHSNNNNTDSIVLDRPLGRNTDVQVNSIPASMTHNEKRIRKIRYQANESLKELKPIHQFKFIRSPHSVKEIWQEYAEGVKGQPSVKEMDSRYHSAWRKDPAVSKRYSRRRVLCKAIENGLTKGYDLETVIELLENHRIMDQGRGTKQPLGWLCQPSNIPETFK